MIGQILRNRYHILKPLGAGGFGETYLASDRQNLNHPCVVKLLKPKTTDAEFRAIAERLFDREINTLTKLGGHPKIPYILDHLLRMAIFILSKNLLKVMY